MCFKNPLHASSAGRILIRLQTYKHLAHPLLGTPISTSRLSLPTQIDQLGNPLPRSTPRSGVLSFGQKLFGFLLGLGFLLVDFAVVGFVERVDVLLGRGDGFFLFALGGFVAAGQVGVALFAPFADRFTILFA